MRNKIYAAFFIVLAGFILYTKYVNLTNEINNLKQQLKNKEMQILQLKNKLKNKNFECEMKNKKLKLQKDLVKKEVNETKIPNKQGSYTIDF